MRDRNHCLGATGEGGKLQCDEGSKEEFTEVHDYLKFLSSMEVTICRGCRDGVRKSSREAHTVRRFPEIGVCR